MLAITKNKDTLEELSLNLGGILIYDKAMEFIKE